MVGMSRQGTSDVELWLAWRNNPSKENLQKLLKQLDPLIMSQVRNWSGTISQQRLRVKALVLTKRALNSYDPSKGALSTHVTTRLQKLSREVYQYQNAARLPEHQQIKYRTYSGAVAKLEDEFGRRPTHDELSDELAWSKKQVAQYEGQLRGDYVVSAGVINDFFVDGVADTLMLDYIYNDLTPDEKRLFELTSGYRGVKPLANPQLMRELKMTQGQLSYAKRKLVAKIKKIKTRLGH